MTERKQISLQKDDTQAALGEYQRDGLIESADWLEDCADCMDDEGLDRDNHARHFRAGANAIRATLTAQLTKTDDNVSCPSVANTGDINAELLEALKEVEWSKGGFCPICGGSIHGTIGGEIIKTHKDNCKIGQVITRAEQKGQHHDQH